MLLKLASVSARPRSFISCVTKHVPGGFEPGCKLICSATAKNRHSTVSHCVMDHETVAVVHKRKEGGSVTSTLRGSAAEVAGGVTMVSYPSGAIWSSRWRQRASPGRYPRPHHEGRRLLRS